MGVGLLGVVGMAVPAVEARDGSRLAPAATTARTSGRGRGRGRGADQAERSQVLAGSPASVSRSEAGVGWGESGNVRGPEVLTVGSWRARGGGRVGCAGSRPGIVVVGRLGWGGGLRGQRVADKAAAPPAARPNGMNGL